MLLKFQNLLNLLDSCDIIKTVGVTIWRLCDLGTAVLPEGVPSLFCNCKVCKDSRARGGKNIRSRSQALINGEVLIDFNADTVAHFLKYGYDCDKVRACLITHRIAIICILTTSKFWASITAENIIRSIFTRRATDMKNLHKNIRHKRR